MIGLPDSVRACLFDLDGVLTQTATLHAVAWKEMFDDYLRELAARTGEEFVPFDPVADYDKYVDGKPRYDGVRSFLAARGIELAEGDPGDPLNAETVRGLSDRKNEIVLRMFRERGVEVYEGSVRYLEAARDAGLRRAVVSSSANTRDVLVAAGIEGFFEARIDGVLAEREGLRRAGEEVAANLWARHRAADEQQPAHGQCREHVEQPGLLPVEQGGNGGGRTENPGELTAPSPRPQSCFVFSNKPVTSFPVRSFHQLPRLAIAPEAVTGRGVLYVLTLAC